MIIVTESSPESLEGAGVFCCPQYPSHAQPFGFLTFFRISSICSSIFAQYVLYLIWYIVRSSIFLPHKSGGSRPPISRNAGEMESSMYKKYMKRAIDMMLALTALIVLLPVYLLLSVWIRLDSPGPVLFVQRRVGKDKKLFSILKFRTMRSDAPHDLPTHLLTTPEAHITRAGRFLRLTSLDELPQLWNILIGNMSIIGPRPALWNQDDLIAERDRYGANSIRPGLTGWAQIHGRDALEIAEKARLDGEYVNNLTLRMDLTCFLYTFGTVLRRTGIIEGGTGMVSRQYEARKDEIEKNKGA